MESFDENFRAKARRTGNLDGIVEKCDETALSATGNLFDIPSAVTDISHVKELSLQNVDAPKLTFVNHAGFCMEYGDVCLVIDPWVEGEVFNKSWSLLSPTPQSAFDCLARATHVWFSHEHPDHFFPPNVGKYLAGKHFLFQKTKDKRVVDYLSKLSDKVTELDFGKRFDLGSKFSIKVFPFGKLDSYCVLDVGDFTILNLNDCYVKDDDEIDFIKRQCPKVDVLFFQFSYAVGNTNANQTAERSRLAHNKLSQLLKTIERFRPKYTCPFASFVYFSSKDNFYLNDSINRIDHVIDKIKGATIPLCFYPGDEWIIGQPRDNSKAIAKYLVDYQNIKPKDESLTDNTVLDILAKMKEFLKTTKSKNPLWRLFYYRRPDAFRIRFDVTDIGATIDFDFKRGVSSPTGDFNNAPICKLRSDALMNLFSFDWGYDTLDIGGRFETDAAGQRNLANIFRFSSQNYQGIFYNLEGVYLILRERLRGQPKYMPLR
ncbi:MAG: MBL fold metallo-hydrolase [Pseudolabrys sp.]